MAGMENFVIHAKRVYNIKHHFKSFNEVSLSHTVDMTWILFIRWGLATEDLACQI